MTVSSRRDLGWRATWMVHRHMKRDGSFVLEAVGLVLALGGGCLSDGANESSGHAGTPVEDAMCRSGTAEQTIRRVQTALNQANRCGAEATVIEQLDASLAGRTQQASIGGTRVRVYAKATPVHVNGQVGAHVNFDLHFAEDYPGLGVRANDPVPSGNPAKPVMRLRSNPHLRCQPATETGTVTRAVAPLILGWAYTEGRTAMDGGEQVIGVCDDGEVVTNRELYDAEALLGYLLFLLESGYYQQTGTLATVTLLRTGGAILVEIAPVAIPATAVIVSAALLGKAFYEYAKSPNYWLCRYRIPCDRFSAGPLDNRPFSAIACHLRENDDLIADSMVDMGFIDTWARPGPDEIATGLVYIEANCGPPTCDAIDFEQTFGGTSWTDQQYRDHGIEPGTPCANCHDLLPEGAQASDVCPAAPDDGPAEPTCDSDGRCDANCAAGLDPDCDFDDGDDPYDDEPDDPGDDVSDAPCDCDYELFVCEADWPGSWEPCYCDVDCVDGVWPCDSDQYCDPYCPDDSDPDCSTPDPEPVACDCDYELYVCEADAPDSADACACDPDCAGGAWACDFDAYCDVYCPVGFDPDC